MHYGVTEEWEQANTYALQASALRKKFGKALILLDFSRSYEIEAFLYTGNEQQAWEEIRQMEKYLDSNQRFRIPYLRSLAILSERDDAERKQTIDYLHEAAQLATKIGLLGERWQIQAALGRVYEAAGEQSQARTEFAEAVRIIRELAQGIKDEILRSRFLAGPQFHLVFQQAQYLATSISDDHTPRGQ